MNSVGKWHSGTDLSPGQSQVDISSALLVLLALTLCPGSISFQSGDIQLVLILGYSMCQ